MADHTITWNHQHCDHTLDDDGDMIDCSPEGTITCNAVGEGESQCHLMEVETDKRGWCDSWSLCDGGPNSHTMGLWFEHHDPGGQHCTEGHPLRVVNYCNALVWIDAGDGVPDSHQDGWPPEFKDGPIDIEWMGEGYVWSYVSEKQKAPVSA